MEVFKWIFSQNKLFFDIAFLFPLITDRLEYIESSGVSKVKTKRLYNSAFHIFEFLQGVRVISHIDVIVHFGRVDFLVFARYPQTSDTHKLVLVFSNLVSAREFV